MIVKVKAAKEKIRGEYKAKRLGLSVSDVSRVSQIICRRLLNELDWTAVRSVHVYKPISKLNELDTSMFTKELTQLFPRTEVTLGSQNNNSAIPTMMFDVIIVPVLAFDKAKYRLGWGGGWYDRSLANQSRALKIGLAYESSLITGSLPHEPHDIKLDKIITERKIY